MYIIVCLRARVYHVAHLAFSIAHVQFDRDKTFAEMQLYDAATTSRFFALLQTNKKRGKKLNNILSKVADKKEERSFLLETITKRMCLVFSSIKSQLVAAVPTIRN